ncbi:hypothetical protein TrVFT333_011789 [Trichoderma virens FT-333]|nr:hypothetical protein TrVFT333_011789 [Trichoderma virens FT-333]
MSFRFRRAGRSTGRQGRQSRQDLLDDNVGSPPPSGPPQFPRPQPNQHQERRNNKIHLRNNLRSTATTQPNEQCAPQNSQQDDLQCDEPQWQLQPQLPGQEGYIVYAKITPASLGYDESPNDSMCDFDVTNDIKTLQDALGSGNRDNSGLISVLTNPKYRDPRALRQLKIDYEFQTERSLFDDVESIVEGDVKPILLALIRGPLDHDIYYLEKALSSESAREKIEDVLLCRSNADICAIVNRFNSAPGKDLLQLIKNKVDKNLFHLYSIILSDTRAEDAAPGIFSELKHNVRIIRNFVELHHPTSADIDLIIDILASANVLQLEAMSEIYHVNHGTEMSDIYRKLNGGIRDALSTILSSENESVLSDVEDVRTWQRASKEYQESHLYRALRLYWGDSTKLEKFQKAFNKFRGRPVKDHLGKWPAGDKRDLIIALIGEKEKPKPKYTCG